MLSASLILLPTRFERRFAKSTAPGSCVTCSTPRSHVGAPRGRNWARWSPCATGCRTELVAQRHGCLPVPLEVAVSTNAGVTRHSWPGSTRELRLPIDVDTLVRVEVDPRRRNLTDARRLDDVRVFGEPNPWATSQVGASLLTRLLGFFHLAFSLAGP